MYINVEGKPCFKGFKINIGILKWSLKPPDVFGRLLATILHRKVCLVRT